MEISELAKDWLIAAGIGAGSVGLGLAVRLLWRRLLSPLIRRTETKLDDAVFLPFRNLVIGAICLTGVYFAVRSLEVVHQDPDVMEVLRRFYAVGWVVLATKIAIDLLVAAIRLRAAAAIAERPEAARDVQTRSGFFSKLAVGVGLVFGGLYLLSILGVDVGPLLAGGAVGGIVLGLALQDTLANVFAGLFMNIDRPVKIGDLIKLETGDEGFVEEIGWRYTKIRLWSNNLVIVPNLRLSQSVLTNFNVPADATSVYVRCGVAYESDLEAVEAIVVKVAKAVQDADEGADRAWEPLVRFKEFGESAIYFTAILRAADVNAQFRIQSSFIKALHLRFREEGIDIPFPVRSVRMQTVPGRAE